MFKEICKECDGDGVLRAEFYGVRSCPCCGGDGVRSKEGKDNDDEKGRREAA